MSLLDGSVELLALPAQETELARESSQTLHDFANPEEHRLTLRLEDPLTGQTIEAAIPAVAVHALSQVLAKLAEGHPVTLLPLLAELSTQQAADLLNVSRPYLVKLLDEGQIPSHQVGTQRRIRCNDLLLYLRNYQQEAFQALAAMTAEAQQTGLYDE